MAIIKGRKIPFAVIDELIEVDYGQWENCSREEVSRLFGESYKRWQIDPAGNRPDGGESGYDVASRTIPIIWQIAVSDPGCTAVVVAHNTVNRVILTHFLGYPLMQYRSTIQQSATAINLLTYYSDGLLAVRRVNDVLHENNDLLGEPSVEEILANLRIC